MWVTLDGDFHIQTYVVSVLRSDEMGWAAENGPTHVHGHVWFLRNVLRCFLLIPLNKRMNIHNIRKLCTGKWLRKIVLVI